MGNSSELRLAPLRMIGLAEPGNWRAGPASVAPAPSESRVASAAAPAQDERPTARSRPPEPLRAQGAEQRLKKNRLERDPSQIGMRVPEREASFGDFLDLINPLHHIPIVGTIYRAMTGDEIGGSAKILGGLLFGGPIGFIAAIFDTLVAQVTGRDLGQTVLAAFIDRDPAPAVQLAEARDIQSISAPDDASEDSPAPAGGAAGPISGHQDPFGLARGVAATIAPTPGAVTPGAAGEAPERPAAVAQGPGAVPAPVAVGAAGAPVVAVVAVELVSAGASAPGNPRLVPNPAVGGHGFAERMLEALDKYQAQAAERFRDNDRTTRRLDLAL